MDGQKKDVISKHVDTYIDTANGASNARSSEHLDELVYIYRKE